MTNSNLFYNPTDEVIKHVTMAQSEHSPRKWFVAYSGGSDSAVLLQALIESGLFEQYQMEVMTIDTELGSAGHIERVTNDIVKAIGRPCQVYKGKGLAWYIDNVHKFGFGYRITHHAPYYQYLKRTAIEACIRENKFDRKDRIAFLTGVRRSESVFRAKRPILQRNGARLTVNAIATFNDADKLPYLHRATWYQGKTTKDCMCNWHARFQLADLQGTEAYEPICKLSQEMIDDGLWGYGTEPDENWLVDDDQVLDMDEDSLCINCMSQLPLFPMERQTNDQS